MSFYDEDMQHRNYIEVMCFHSIQVYEAHHLSVCSVLLSPWYFSPESTLYPLCRVQISIVAVFLY